MVSRSPGIRPTSAAIGTVLLLGSGTASFADEKIEFFFVGRQHCGFSQRVVDTGVLPGLVENIRKEAQRRGAAFESICVNADTDPEAAETFVRLACGGFDRVVSTGEGLDTAEIQKYAYEPPSQHSMDFAPGAVGTPYALILRRVDGQLIANRWISAIVVTLANRLEGLDDGTPLPDNMMPPKPADP